MTTSEGSASTGRRRFVPVVISTVKDQFRLPSQQKQLGPALELTPEPSPTEEVSPLFSNSSRQVHSQTQTTNSEPKRLEGKKRRFAPQLIETSRRCRRTGDTSPATRPADKTDITPWTNHIYVPRPRQRFDQYEESSGLTTPTGGNDETALDDGESLSSDGDMFPSDQRIFSRRESMTADGLRLVLENERKEIARARKKREMENMMSAFPNYPLAAHEGVEHFHAREGSEDEHDQTQRTEKMEGPKALRRRDSEMNWFTKEHQQHASAIAKARGDSFHPHEDDEDDLLETPGHEGPPAAPIWVSDEKRESIDSLGISPSRGPMGEFIMPLIPETKVTPYIPSRPTPLTSTAPLGTAPPLTHPIGEAHMPYIPSAPIGKAADMPYVPTSTPFAQSSAAATSNVGFRNGGGFGSARPKVKVITPPMAGEDLLFRKCKSPRQTKMETDHPFFPEPGTAPHRDPTGQKGLWNGYCLARDSQEIMVPAELQGPHMIATPQPPASPSLGASSLGDRSYLSDEPTRMWLPPARTQSKKLELKGLHLVSGLDERLKHEKEQAELMEKIIEEFDDSFVTQVYNYLSLGYPIMARDFDAELSKISRIPLEELRRDDADIMAKGRINLSLSPNENDENRGPRWHALKKYIVEWARQHPNLSFDGPDPLHWGMRERRGSWAI